MKMAGDAAARARYRERHRERYLAQSRAASARYAAKLKSEMIAAYGGGCTCCGETHPAFLAMDHVNGREKGDRLKDLGAWRKARGLGWPDDFTCLCHNCNQGRQINGGTCPHVDEDEDDA